MTGDQEMRVRQMLEESVPLLPDPPDRVAAVGARVRRRRATVTSVAVLATVVAGAGLSTILPSVLRGPSNGYLPAAPAAEVLSASTPGCAGSGVAADYGELAQVVDRLRPVAEASYADSFTELTLTDRVIVYRKPSAGFDAWVMGEFKDQCVELYDAPYSGRGVAAILERVEADRQHWMDEGIEINTLSVDHNGTITVGVPEDQGAKAKALMPGRYETPVMIVPGDAVPLLIQPT